MDGLILTGVAALVGAAGLGFLAGILGGVLTHGRGSGPLVMIGMIAGGTVGYLYGEPYLEPMIGRQVREAVGSETADEIRGEISNSAYFQVVREVDPVFAGAAIERALEVYYGAGEPAARTAAQREIAALGDWIVRTYGPYASEAGARAYWMLQELIARRPLMERPFLCHRYHYPDARLDGEILPTEQGLGVNTADVVNALLRLVETVEPEPVAYDAATAGRVRNIALELALAAHPGLDPEVLDGVRGPQSREEATLLCRVRSRQLYELLRRPRAYDALLQMFEERVPAVLDEGIVEAGTGG